MGTHPTLTLHPIGSTLALLSGVTVALDVQATTLSYTVHRACGRLSWPRPTRDEEGSCGLTYHTAAAAAAATQHTSL